MSDIVKVKRDWDIGIITINRPEKLNALNHQVLNELEPAVTKLLEDKQIRGVLITGEGEKAFVAGADISEISRLARDEGRRFAERGQRIFNSIEKSPKPVIAAVNGFALGGGCELALACHFRIAAQNARLGQPEVNLGIIPGFGGTQRLARLIGKGRAMEMCLTGTPVDADEALRIGLVNRVVPPDQLIETSLGLLHTIAAKAPLAVEAVIDSIHRGLDVPQNKGMEIEAENFSRVCATDDMKEGTAAFMEKRPAQFVGR